MNCDRESLPERWITYARHRESEFVVPLPARLFAQSAGRFGSFCWRGDETDCVAVFDVKYAPFRGDVQGSCDSNLSKCRLKEWTMLRDTNEWSVLRSKRTVGESRLLCISQHQSWEKSTAKEK